MTGMCACVFSREVTFLHNNPPPYSVKEYPDGWAVVDRNGKPLEGAGALFGWGDGRAIDEALATKKRRYVEGCIEGWPASTISKGPAREALE